MTERERAAEYRRIAKERKAEAEAAERAERDKIEVVASLGSGKPNIVGKNLTEVGEKLTLLGYRMNKSKPMSSSEVAKLLVPHKDGFKEATVRVRRRKGGE